MLGAGWFGGHQGSVLGVGRFVGARPALRHSGSPSSHQLPFP